MKTACFGAGLAALLVSSAALAQGVDEFGPYGGLRDRDLQSPQNAAVEVRFGPYVPNADDGVNGTPFRDTFGNEDGEIDDRYLLGIEVDWQALRLGPIASFGPGFGIGYTRLSARAPFQDGSGRSPQRTSLSILPMYLVGVLRVDVMPKKIGVPLVPYAKLGLGYALWWSEDGDDVAEIDDVRAEGRSFGPQGALGLMFLLDPLEPSAAASFDANLGVNNSYLFAEWYVSKLDGFGGDHLQVGTNTWMVGIALEM